MYMDTLQLLLIVGNESFKLQIDPKLNEGVFILCFSKLVMFFQFIILLVYI
jgi:hypothetical protein